MGDTKRSNTPTEADGELRLLKHSLRSVQSRSHHNRAHDREMHAILGPLFNVVLLQRNGVASIRQDAWECWRECAGNFDEYKQKELKNRTSLPYFLSCSFPSLFPSQI